MQQITAKTQKTTHLSGFDLHFQMTLISPIHKFGKLKLIQPIEFDINSDDIIDKELDLKI